MAPPARPCYCGFRRWLTMGSHAQGERGVLHSAQRNRSTIAWQGRRLENLPRDRSGAASQFAGRSARRSRNFSKALMARSWCLRGGTCLPGARAHRACIRSGDLLRDLE